MEGERRPYAADKGGGYEMFRGGGEGGERCCGQDDGGPMVIGSNQRAGARRYDRPDRYVFGIEERFAERDLRRLVIMRGGIIELIVIGAWFAVGVYRHIGEIEAFMFP